MDLLACLDVCPLLFNVSVCTALALVVGQFVAVAWVGIALARLCLNTTWMLLLLPAYTQVLIRLTLLNVHQVRFVPEVAQISFVRFSLWVDSRFTDMCCLVVCRWWFTGKGQLVTETEGIRLVWVESLMWMMLVTLDKAIAKFLAVVSTTPSI